MLRTLAALMATLVLLFLLNNYLVYWRGWPEFSEFLAGSLSPYGWIQLIAYTSLLAATAGMTLTTPARTLCDDADLYTRMAGYIVRASYWAVLLIGLFDMLISFLRVEGFLEIIIGKHLAIQLGRPVFRGVYLHYPLLAAALVIAWFSRSLGFIWLALLIVIAEFQVVISRFVFSYEQVFMGDLVRFWCAAMFLFSSAYTLAREGHVRVDLLYANFSAQAKARVNIAGSFLLGLPFCWTIMLQGMSNKGSSIISPLLGFEISQSGYGMYVKYLMAGFLLVFAISMAFQFIATFLTNAAQLQDQAETPS